jgi:hypothetical protein
MTMSLFDWSFLNPLGRAVIAAIETVISLSGITSLLSPSAALVATWVVQVTTHQAGLGTSSARPALVQRIALAALAIFLMLSAVTPFITPTRLGSPIFPWCLPACHRTANLTIPLALRCGPPVLGHHLD